MSQEIIHLINRARDEARRDNLKSFLLKNKAFITIIALVCVIALAIALLSFNDKFSRQEKYSEVFYKILNSQNISDEKYQSELKNLIEKKSVPNGIKSLVAIRLASELIDQNKKSEAYEIYKKINADDNYDQYVRELSGLLMAQILVENIKENDKEVILEEISRIENNAKILKYHVMEQRGILQFQAGDFEKAVEIFKSIAQNPESSNEIKNRAIQMAEISASKIK